MINRNSYIGAFIAFVISFGIVFGNTGEVIGSLSAAVLTAALVWIAYVITRWLFLSFRK